MIEVTLPPPPTANNLFPTVGKRRIKSARYRAWIEEAGLLLNTQATEPLPGAVTAAIELPDKLRGDIDGYAKATLDLFVSHRLIDDDRHVRELWMGFAARPDMKVRIEQHE